MSNKEAKRTEKHISISDRADEIMDAEIAKGAGFSEALCNWAIGKAERELGNQY